VAQTSIPHRAIWSFTWPATLSNLSIPLLSLVDTAILGHLDNATHLSAVAVGGTVITLLYWAFSFLRMGTTSLSARSFGAGRPNDSIDLLLRSLGLAAVIGLVLASLGQTLLWPLVSWVGELNEVAVPAYNYSAIRLYSAPATLMTYALVGWFLGQQRPRISLVILLVTNLSNIVLDYIFIVLWGLNSEGAAWASLAAEYLGWITGMACLLRNGELAKLKQRFAVLFDPAPYRQLIKLNQHLFVRTLALQLCFVFFTAQSARQGELVLAANTILINLLLTTAYGLDGVAHAAEALVGKAIGAGRLEDFKATCRGCTLWSMFIAASFSMFFLVSASWLPGTFTDLPQVLDIISQYYPWLVALPLLSVWCYLLDGIFIGAGKTADMQRFMLLASFGVFLPAWWLGQDLGNHGLWLAFCLWNLSRGLGLGLRFYQINMNHRWLMN
jgi:MATE family multidrug resistance protein